MRLYGPLLFWLTLFPMLSRAQERDLGSLSIEDLINVKVTSVAKKEQTLLESPAAIFVITQEDIRRSGMTSVPELLRMVPGINVAQVDGNVWAISARGFNSQFANKLLVLIDGRSVYSPLFSGVYWEVQDLLLEDIDRIEVIRGPGAAVWGANAVNGVINILTKHAAETKGGLVTAGASTAEQRFVGFRYGGKSRQLGDFRLFSKYNQREGMAYPSGARSPDGLEVWRGGFRVDTPASARDTLTWQGDVYRGTLGQHVVLPAVDPLTYSTDETVDIAGGNLLARWTRTYSPRSDFSLQGYIDTTRRSELFAGQRITTFDLQFQQRYSLGPRQDVVWGLGYRRMEDRLRSSNIVTFNPENRGTNLFSGFVEDEILIVPQHFRLTVGSKFEHDDYTGAQAEPTIRISYSASTHHQAWASVSRAVRTPSRAEWDVRGNLASMLDPHGTPVLVGLLGSHLLGGEKLWAYEAGYRWQFSSRLSLDVATFLNHYKDLNIIFVGQPAVELSPPPPHVFVPALSATRGQATAGGTEAALTFRPANFWQLATSYSWLEVKKSPPLTSYGSADEFSPIDDPRHQFNLRSTVYLPQNFSVDANTYYVSRLQQQQTPPYVRFDIRLAWNPTERVQFSVGGQNLLEDRHSEFRSLYVATPTEARRSAYFRVTWAF